MIQLFSRLPDSFQSSQHKAFNGACLAVLQSNTIKGRISITPTAEGLVSSTFILQAN